MENYAMFTAGTKRDQKRFTKRAGPIKDQVGLLIATVRSRKRMLPVLTIATQCHAQFKIPIVGSNCMKRVVGTG